MSNHEHTEQQWRWNPFWRKKGQDDFGDEENIEDDNDILYAVNIDVSLMRSVLDTKITESRVI